MNKQQKGNSVSLLLSSSLLRLHQASNHLSSCNQRDRCSGKRTLAFHYKYFCAILFLNLCMYNFHKKLKREKKLLQKYSLRDERGDF